jgi:parallel beta-helix repeat protein
VLAWVGGFISNKNISRMYEYVIRDRILLPIWITMTSPEENVRTTQLPVYELDINPRYLDALNADLLSNQYDPYYLDKRSTTGDLPSYKQYKPAIFRHGGNRYRVEVRYRGDNPNHREGHHKSWRIKFKKHDRFANQRLLNLINPKTPSTLTQALGFCLSRRLGIITPRSEFVHTVVNRQYAGVSLFVEQIDELFMINHRLSEGNIYYGEYLAPWSGPHKRMWEDPNAWDRHVICVESQDPRGRDPMDRLVATVALEDNEQFKSELPHLFDLDYWYSVYAHVLLSAHIHRDTFHNHKYYYDPTCDKLRTIMWDPMGFGYPDEVLDPDFWHINQVNHLLTGRILQIPEFVERKNLRLWEALNGPGSLENQLEDFDSQYELVKEDIYCDVYKDYTRGSRRIFSNATFEAEVKRQREWILARHQYLRRELDYADASICRDQEFQPHRFSRAENSKESLPLNRIPESLFVPASYLLTNGGECGVRIGQWTLQFADGFSPVAGSSFYLYYDANDNRTLDPEDILLDTVAGMSVEDRRITFSTDRVFLPGRKKIPSFQDHASLWKRALPHEIARHPARHRLFVATTAPRESQPELRSKVQCFTPLQSNDMQAVNSVTNHPVVLRVVDSSPVESIQGSLPFDPSECEKIQQTLVWRGPVKKIEEDLILDRQTRLVIEPGTVIEFAPEASVLTYGPVVAVGTAENPIQFRSAQPEQGWGVFALQGSGADGSRFRYCRFSGGRDDKLDNVFYSGMLSAYHSNIQVENCHITDAQGDDGINFKFADTGSIRDTEFIGNSADALDLDFSHGVVERCRFQDNGNDGIDLGTASATVRDNLIRNCGDKGISVGEMSSPRLYRNTILNNNVGVASKDMSFPILVDNEIRNNKTGVVCYQKKAKYGPSQIQLENCRIVDNEIDFAADLNSRFAFRESEIPVGAMVAPLPEGIAESPVAPTRITRPLETCLIRMKNGSNF